MMTQIQLSRTRWQDFFDRVSKSLGAQTAKVEVTGIGLGDRIAAGWVPLNGISYEPADDTLTLFLEGLEHRIKRPRAIHVDESFDILHSMEVVGEDGLHHIVQFSAALELPSI